MFFTKTLLCLLIGDALFSYSLEATRTFLDVPLGYELFLSFAYPQPYAPNILFITIGVCLLFTFLAESELGKMPIVLMGLLISVITTSLYAITIYTDEASRFRDSIETLKDSRMDYALMRSTITLFFLYIATSSVRNVLILEQIILPKHFKLLRPFIFWITFLRLIVIALFTVLIYFLEEGKNLFLRQVHSLLNIFLATFYLIFVTTMFFSRKLHIERIRRRIWIAILATFTYAALPKAGTRLALEAAIHKDEEDVGPNDSNSRPNRNEQKPYVYYFFVPPGERSGIADRRPITRGVQSNPTTLQKPRMQERTTEIRNQRIPIATRQPAGGGKPNPTAGYKSGGVKQIPLASKEINKTIREQEPHPKEIQNKEAMTNIATETPKDSRNIPSKEASQAFTAQDDQSKETRPKLNISRGRTSIFNKSKDDKDDPYYQLKHHWIYRARDKSTLSLMEETRRFWSIKFIYVVSFIFNVSSYFILMATIEQDKTLRRTTNEFINKIRISVYYSCFKVILFPICEYIIVPLFRWMKILRTNLQIICFSCFILLLSLCTVLAVQNYLEQRLQYIPSSYFAQLRMYNTLPLPVSVMNKEFGLKVVQPYTVSLIPHIRGERKFNITVRVRSSNQTIDTTNRTELDVYKTLSLIISEKGIKRNSQTTDPTIYTKNRNDSLSYYFIVTDIQIVEGLLSFSNIQNKGLISKKIDPGRQEALYPGSYNISAVINKRTFDFSNSYKIESGALYGLFFYVRDNILKLTVFLAEGPPPLNATVLLGQMILLCMAQALVIVSFFKFLFLETSPKLRCTVFTNVFVFGILAVAISNFYVVQSRFSVFSHVLIAVILIHVFGLIVTIYCSCVYVRSYIM